ncbi:MAG: SDR family NAD(P)-dependent oxidoreductase [Gemmatimonadales bacterium]
MGQARAFPHHAVAVVGLGGRFPGARSLAEFWDNIQSGVESLTQFSEDELQTAGVLPAVRNAPGYVSKGTVLEDADLFDAAFFGMSPREAQILDPQQRLFLECAWEALEHAGYAPGDAQRSVGVYAGASMNTYMLSQILRAPALIAAVGGYQLMLGNDKDFLCTRVSYELDLRGPSMTIQTACSTSLVAVVMACRALAHGECDIALAGGVSISFPQRAGYLYEPGMILSPDGHCRPFDARAGGTRAGSGCGIVVLKRLDEALADRDTIHAVIRGAATNNDGSGKAGYTAPSIDGQVEVIATAQALAGIDAREVTYIEAHGTATPLGDPIEIAALTQVFRASTSERAFCRLGSLKANLGHLDAAAGVAGLIKTILALERRVIPPLVNFVTPNPQLELDTSPFVASSERAEWDGDAPRIAGVSSFGIGGTNAHVVVEEAPRIEERRSRDRPHVLVLSGKTPAALEQATSNLAAYLQQNPDVPIGDVEWTLQVGRTAFRHRRALVVADGAEAIRHLREPQRAPVINGTHDGAARPVVFLFSGQGSQHAGMGAALYAGEVAYRDAVDECAALLEPHLGLDIRSVLRGDAGDGSIDQTWLAQPALFVTEYATAKLWMSWGVRPVAMLGHSIGEYVAAHLAGVLSLADALRVVAARGALMQALPAGSMAAIHLGERELASRLPKSIEIAAVNAPALCTISGPTAGVARTSEQLRGQGIDVRELRTSHAFHSHMMDPAVAPFTDLLRGVSLSSPTIPYASNVTGKWITTDDATSPSYYGRHLRGAVRFAEGVRTVAADGISSLLEVGPGNVLTTLARLTLGAEGAKRTAHSLPRPQGDRDDTTTMRDAVARLWVTGTTLNFEGMHAGGAPYRVPLPTYPFDRKRHWVEAELPAARRDGEPIRDPGRIDDWFTASTWIRDESALRATPSGVWLVLGDGEALSRNVISQLRAAGAWPILVERGAAFARLSDTHFTVRPSSDSDIGAVVRAVLSTRDAATAPTIGAMHLWATGGDPIAAADVFDVLSAVSLGMKAAVAETMLRVLHVSEGAESVLDEPLGHATQGLALGPVLVLPAEVPHLEMRRVDLDTTYRDGPEGTARDLIVEAATAGFSPRVAWRGGRRWKRAQQAIALPPALGPEIPVKPRGVYLITGGLGGLGLAIGRWMAERFQANLLLTSRAAERTRTPRVAEALAAIEAAGSEVQVVAADAADEAAMLTAIDAARMRWGRIDGVVHAAGVAGSGSIAALKAEADARAVWEPKVRGLEVLVSLLGSEPLDLVVLMSSVNSIVGAPGLTDYTAANAVLDAFAEGATKPALWRRVISVNWGPWRDVGMAATLEVPEARQAQRRAFLASAIAPALGVEALGRVLASGRNSVAVSSFDLLGEIRNRETSGRSADVPAEGPGETKTARPEVSVPYEAPGSDIERRLAAIWQDLLGLDQIGRHDDFFELGGHSLLATRVLTRVQESFGTPLSLRDVFDAPNLEALASRIARTIGGEGGLTRSADSADREEIEF